MSSDDSDDNDLSPYELLRLRRIKENAAKLAELGLAPLVAAISARKPQHLQSSSAPKKRQKVRSEVRSKPTRQSSRIRGSSSSNQTEEEDVPKEEDGDDHDQVDYDAFPVDPIQLDDDEFLVTNSHTLFESTFVKGLLFWCGFDLPLRCLRQSQSWCTLLSFTLGCVLCHHNNILFVCCISLSLIGVHGAKSMALEPAPRACN